MKKKRAIQIVFVGLAGLLVGISSGDAIGDALPSGFGWSLDDFFYDGWFNVAAGLITLFGVYCWVTSTGDPN